MARLGETSDHDRFERLFADHFDAVLSYALARADPATADDAVADTFLVAWRRLAEIPELPRAWLIGVTRKTLATHRRSRTRQEAVVQRLGEAPSGMVQRGVDAAAQESAIAREALGQLSESDRELLCLLAWDGLSQREAAKVLGCSFGAFRVRYLRARQRFRSAIERASPLGLIGAHLTPIRDTGTEEKLA